MSTTTPSRQPVTGPAAAPRPRRPLLLDLYGTAVGKKYAMAISGIALMGFVLFHMIGNTKMYLGAVELNEYAEFLKKLLYPLAPKESVLWILRAGLLGTIDQHLVFDRDLATVTHLAWNGGQHHAVGLVGHGAVVGLDPANACCFAKPITD